MAELGPALPHPRVRAPRQDGSAPSAHRSTPRSNRPLQGLVESTNTKIRLLTRVAFGFRSATALIALVMLALGVNRPVLPGRIDPRIGQ